MRRNLWAAVGAALVVGAFGSAVSVPQATRAAESAPQAKLVATIYFAPDSDELSAAAKSQLDGVHKAYPKSALRVVAIHGHADPAECTECGGPSDSYAIGLSQRRAGNVRSYLAGGNIPDGEMVTRAFGGSKSKGKPAAQMRRVEVYFAADSDY